MWHRETRSVSRSAEECWIHPAMIPEQEMFVYGQPLGRLVVPLVVKRRTTSSGLRTILRDLNVVSSVGVPLSAKVAKSCHPSGIEEEVFSFPPVENSFSTAFSTYSWAFKSSFSATFRSSMRITLGPTIAIICLASSLLNASFGLSGARVQFSSTAARTMMCHSTPLLRKVTIRIPGLIPDAARRVGLIRGLHARVGRMSILGIF